MAYPGFIEVSGGGAILLQAVDASDREPRRGNPCWAGGGWPGFVFPGVCLVCSPACWVFWVMGAAKSVLFGDSGAGADRLSLEVIDCDLSAHHASLSDGTAPGIEIDK